jgi:hypothetical protein
MLALQNLFFLYHVLIYSIHICISCGIPRTRNYYNVSRMPIFMINDGLWREQWDDAKGVRQGLDDGHLGVRPINSTHLPSTPLPPLSSLSSLFRFSSYVLSLPQPAHHILILVFFSSLFYRLQSGSLLFAVCLTSPTQYPVLSLTGAL